MESERAGAVVDEAVLMNTVAPILAAFALAAQPSANPQPAKIFVKFSQGRISIRAVEVPLKDLADEIRKQSGIVVEVKDPKAAEKRITLELNNVAPAVAFEDILRGLNFASFYEAGRLAQVVILSPESGPAPVTPAKPTPARSQPVRRPTNPAPDFDEMLERNQAEGLRAIAQAVKGNDRRNKLAALEALDTTEHPEVFRILGEALSDADEPVRKAALKVLEDKDGPAVMPLLKVALRDTASSIRIDAIEALADKGEFQLMTSVLTDPDEGVREKARDLLERARKSGKIK